MVLDKGFKEVEFYQAYKQRYPSRLKSHVKKPALVAQFIYAWWHAGQQNVTIIKPRSISNQKMNISGVALKYYVCAN